MERNEFPVYRKTNDGKHYYRIDGPDRFLELQRVGKRVVQHSVTGGAYPELVRIDEMIRMAEDRYGPSTEAEFVGVLEGSDKRA